MSGQIKSVQHVKGKASDYDGDYNANDDDRYGGMVGEAVDMNQEVIQEGMLIMASFWSQNNDDDDG
jgi:hypothetical protein